MTSSGSPLDQINLDNVDDLSLAWCWNTDTKRGLESTPIVVDGIMFNSGAWSGLGTRRENWRAIVGI